MQFLINQYFPSHFQVLLILNKYFLLLFHRFIVYECIEKGIFVDSSDVKLLKSLPSPSLKLLVYTGYWIYRQ